MMRKRRAILYSFLGGSFLFVAGILLAQTAPDRALIVNGKPAGKVVRMDGHSYVDVETLAQATNGSVTIEPDRVVLTIPAPETNGTSGEANPPAAPPPEGLTKNFASEAIGVLAEMREWRGAVGTILAYNVPVVGTWPQDYRDQVKASLDQLSVVATTRDDEASMQVLRNEFSTLSQWASNVVATRDSLNATNTVRPDAVQNDPVLAKITACSRFLGSMLVSGTFADNPSCH
jgi:hypothetical protein